MRDHGTPRVFVWLAAALSVSFLVYWNSGYAQTLSNGIAQKNFPPQCAATQTFDPAPYLIDPPSVIPIDQGRQLFVDDFLIEQTTLVREQHRPVMYSANPILTPLPGGSLAMPYSDGVWYDPDARLFKMWYYEDKYVNSVSYAYSSDGVNWTRPSIADAPMPNTNAVLLLPGVGPRDSVSVLMDRDDPDASRRFKAFAYDPTNSALLYAVYFSPDGIHWTREPNQVTSLSDRSTVFYSPYRNAWIISDRSSTAFPASALRDPYSGRARFYSESVDLTHWLPADPQSSFWTSADESDPPYYPNGEYPELYNLDAISYESLTVGLFSWFYPGAGYSDYTKPGPILVELGAGFTRDGFHWVRPTRGFGPNAFIPASNAAGTWNAYNTQSAGGCFLIVGDELWFYFSGRTLQKPLSGIGSTGLAILRRDGFYSMSAGSTEGTLLTKPVQFSGKHLFVNVDAPQGELRAEILDVNNNVISPFTLANSAVISVDRTLQELTWNGGSDLSAVAGKPVRLRFHLTNGKLYSFWITASSTGASFGYMAAGGPGIGGSTDTLGSAATAGFAAMPSISPAPATYLKTTTVSLSTPTPGAIIRYTLDGSDPNSSSTQYSAPFKITANSTVKARAFLSGSQTSAVNSAAYSIVSDSAATMVTVTSPASYETLAGSCVFSANAAGDVKNIQFTLDGQNVGNALAGPVASFTWNTVSTPNGTHALTAIATDSKGAQTAATPVLVSVQNPWTPPLAGSWTFDASDISGNSVLDASGHGHAATTFAITTVPGVLAQAAQFNGTTSHVDVSGDTGAELINDLTLSVWIKTTNSSRYETIISKYDASGSESGYLLRTTPAGTIDVLLGGNQVLSGSRELTDPTPIHDGNWHHVAVVFRMGIGINIYIDGKLTSTSCLRPVVNHVNATLQFGVTSWLPYGNYFTGSMDQISIYDGALWNTGIQSLYQPGAAARSSASSANGILNLFRRPPGPSAARIPSCKLALRSR